MCPYDTATLSSRIREEALRLGFFNTGIAPAGNLPYEAHFKTWLNEGFHGEMRYLERQAAKRRNPGLVLANVRSIIAVALNYFTNCLLSTEPLKGRISRYALGDDYHEPVSIRLERLLDFIKKLQPSVNGRCYVDTGPVMEKVWGAQSALGWIGKHTNLISRHRGSFFFIGTILLDIELEYDLEQKDFCGTCSRCIQACPTGAIVAPYILDARLCVSYLTIEFRGAIPYSLRPSIGNRVFGCDDCQDVCPWNRFAAETSEKEFYPRTGIVMPDLVPLARITPGATRDGFVRNVVVALGNSGRIEAVPPLSEALRDSSPLVRSHAAWALGRIGSPRANRILESARVLETDESVLQEIAAALDSLENQP